MRARLSLRALGALLTAGLAACAVTVENLEPARELAAARSAPSGSVYLGWRVYTDRCARCHGADAGGGDAAPGLLERLRGVGPRRFADLVLLRYEWEGMPAAPLRQDPRAREAGVDDVLRRSEPLQQMPAWQGEPRVTAHILDLHAYLAARAGGTLGPGRPPG